MRLRFGRYIHPFKNIFDWEHYDGRYPRLVPNREFTYYGPIIVSLPPTKVKLNNYGFRGSNFHVKLPGQILIECFGDSMTFGIGVNEDETIPYFLEKELKRRLNLGNLEVFNMAILGMNFVEEETLFEDFGLKFKPNIAVFFFFSNDFSPSLYKEMYRTRYLLLPHLDLLRLFAFNLWASRSSLPPSEQDIENFRASAQRLIELSRNKDIEIYIVVLEFQPDYEKLVWQTFSSAGVPCLNLSALHKNLKWVHLNEIDTHYNPLGTQLMAEKTADFLIAKSRVFKDKRE